MRLGYKALYTEPKPLQNILAIVVHTEKDRLSARSIVQDFSCGIQAVKDRHGDFQDHNFRLEFQGKTDCILPVLCVCIHAVPFSLKECLHTITNDLMVVS